MRKHMVTRLVAGLLFAAAIIVLILGIVAASAIGASGGWGPGSRAWLVLPILIITFFNTGILLVFGATLFFLTKIETNLEILRGRGQPGRPRPQAVAPPSAPTLAYGLSAPEQETAAATAATATTAAATAAAAAATAAAAAVAADEAASAEPSSTEPAPQPASEGVPPETAMDVPPAPEVPPQPASEGVPPETAIDRVPPAPEVPPPSEDGAPEPPSEPTDTSAQLPGGGAYDSGTGETPQAQDAAANSEALNLPGAEAAARIAREMAELRPAPFVPPMDGAPVEPPPPPEEPAK